MRNANYEMRNRNNNNAARGCTKPKLEDLTAQRRRDLTFCRLWRNVAHTAAHTICPRHGTRSAHEQQAASSFATTAAEPSFQLTLSGQSSVRTRRAKYANATLDAKHEVEYKTRAAADVAAASAKRTPKCVKLVNSELNSKSKPKPKTAT